MKNTVKDILNRVNEIKIEMMEEKKEDNTMLIINIMANSLLNIEFKNKHIAKRVDSMKDFINSFQKQFDYNANHNACGYVSSFNVQSSVQSINDHIYRRDSEINKFNSLFKLLPEELQKRIIEGNELLSKI